MFGFKRRHKTILVEFYEQGESTPFGSSEVPIDQLPDTFQIQTTLSIGDEEWCVSQAIPPAKEVFRQIGRVKVFLYKPRILEDVSLDEILFGLPTIADDIAAIENTSSLENVFVVHEDDWRQCELISLRYVDGIKSEMEEIRHIYETEKVSVGFKKCHLRSAIPAPLEGVHLTLRDLKARLGESHLFRSVAFNHVAGVIQMGFAFRTSEGYILWGQCHRNREVAFVCVFAPAERPIEQGVSDSFVSLLSENRLVLVDWVGLTTVPDIATLA